MSKQTDFSSDAAQPGGTYDCIIVGAGHNGLATGLVLARNGKKVLLLVAAFDAVVVGLPGEGVLLLLGLESAAAAVPLSRLEEGEPPRGGF